MKELKAVRLTREIRELYDQLHAHQDKCKHTKATEVEKSDIVNFEYCEVSYWYECSCPTCLKTWREDQ